MAICNNCNKEYISKECPYCNNINKKNNEETLNIYINTEKIFDNKTKKLINISINLYLIMTIFITIIGFSAGIYVLYSMNQVQTIFKKIDNVWDKNKKFTIGNGKNDNSQRGD